jgi:cell division protein ZapA (FtsZ GTPase activity inhibitor)
MRAIFGVLSLLLVLAVVGLLVKKQLVSTQQAIPALASPASTSSDSGSTSPKPAGTVQEQSQQIQQQYKQALDAAMQQARPVPDDQ